MGFQPNQAAAGQRSRPRMGRRPGGLALWAATCSTRRAANGRCSSHSLTLWLLLTLTLSLSHSHSAVRASELCCSTPLSLGGRPLPDSTRAQGGSRGLPGPPRQPRPAALSRSPRWGCPRAPPQSSATSGSAVSHGDRRVWASGAAGLARGLRVGVSPTGSARFPGLRFLLFSPSSQSLSFFNPVLFFPLFM